MEDFLSNMMNRNLLRYAVQQTIFCPRCQSVMDMRRAVNISVMREATGQCLRSFTICASCFDAKREDVERAATMVEGVKLDILDGRILFARPKRTKKAKKEVAA